MPAPARASAALPALPEDLDIRSIRRAVLDWYDAHGRSLPFRGVQDPWAILVSESMAQQTQAARAGEAWRGFIATYPTPRALAAASPAEVLRAWRGLGYNRRAVALRSAAVAIVGRHDGRVPDDLGALDALPGIGPYTARAVLALAFGRPVAPVDTNVRRVLGRLVPGVAGNTAGIQALADALVDADRPGDWTHALMDVGARICRPTRPDCAACPLLAWCASGRTGILAGGAGHRRAGSRRVREPAATFRSTSRWLRGRLVDLLRDADDGEWVRVGAAIGEHDEPAIAVALASLERDGLVERHPEDPGLARLPRA